MADYITFQPSDYFNTKLYVADQQDNRTITGVGFQPDFVWLRDRDQTVSHQLYDAVRGALKSLASNTTNAEATETDTLKAFASDGFTLGTGWGNQTTGDKYVSWNWRAGAGQGSSNTDGSINTTYTSVNTTAGFSISQYTGTGSAATIGHGLGVAPDVVIIKSLDQTRIWIVGMEALGNWNKYLALSATDAEQTSSTYFPSAPTSTLVNLGNGANVNNSSENYIAYCFKQKKGFSKFGSYLGLGASGNFIYCGFKPAFVIVKRIDGSANWVMTDNKFSFNGRGTHDSYVMFPSADNQETDSYGLLLVSNGFQIRGSDSTSATVNGSSAEYIYWAFAEEPIVSSNGVAATAR